MSPKLASILQKIAQDLAWRGPGGNPQGHIVLSRDQAETLLQEVHDLRVQVGEQP